MKRAMLASTVVFALALVLTTFPVEQAWAACNPIDLSDSDWNLNGSMKASAKKVGKVNLKGQLDLFFGPNAGEGLGNDQFKVVDPEGDSFEGSYQTDLKGKMQLTPESISLEDYIKDKIVSMAAGHSVSYSNLQGISYKTSAKVKSAKTGISLSASVSVKATADISVDGQPAKKTKICISLRANGTKVMSVASTRWMIDTTSKGGVKGLGKVKYQGTLDLIVGPNGSEGVPANEFRAIDDEGRMFTGFYSVDTKDRVTVEPDWSQLEAFLVELIEDESGAQNVSVNITKVKCTAMVKHAMSIKMTLSIKFTAEGYYQGQYGSGKGSFSQKGTGCATEYQL